MTATTTALTEMQIPYSLFRHAKPVHSLEQAAQERGQRPGQIVRSILFRLGKEQYVMVLIAGAGQISWKRLRRHLGQSRLTMASPEEVLAVTGYRVGTVSPFGLLSSIPILVDESVLAQEALSIGSGERGIAVMIRKMDLMQALGDVEVGQFAA